MKRGNWDHATGRLDNECPRCGEERMVDLVNGKHPMYFCCVCGHNWKAKKADAD
jgi:uncharacterized protein (DUF983 family)